MKIGRILLLAYFIILVVIPVNTVESSESFEELSMVEKQKLITGAAVKYGIPPEILKAIASLEPDMQQFDKGEPFLAEDGGVGIMHVKSPDFEIDEEKLKYDTAYNIDIGAKTLKSKWDMQKNGGLPKINDGNPQIIENWYFAIMAYNGLSKENDPNLNQHPFQQKVFDNIERNSGIDLMDIPEISLDYEDEDKLVFKKMHYQWENAKAFSTQMIEKNNRVFVMNTNNPYYFNYTNLRQEPSSEGEVIKRIPYYTKLTVVDGPFFDKANKSNHTVFYKVTADEINGYVSSLSLRSIDQLNTSFYLWDEGKQQIVAKDKVWSIKMSVPLQGSTVHPRNVYVTDEKGNGVFTKISYDINENRIKVEPREKYQPGRSYTLHIQNMKSNDGVKMDKAVAVNFKIELE
jgi:hypothetical protein